MIRPGRETEKDKKISQRLCIMVKTVTQPKRLSRGENDAAFCVCSEVPGRKSGQDRQSDGLQGILPRRADHQVHESLNR